jgi:hypothetical protein
VRTLAVLAGAATATVLLAGCAAQADAPGAAAKAASTQALTEKKQVATELASLSATEVAAKAGAALTQAGTVHVRGSFVSAGEAAVLDLKVKGTQGATGTIKVRGATLTLLRNGSSTYLKSDAAGWTQLGAGAGATMLAGKWVKVAGTDPDFTQIADFTRLDKLAALLLDDDMTGVKVARTTYAGKPAVQLSDREGSMLVAASGKPYPLRVTQLVTKAGADAGTITFSDFGKPVNLTEPPADEVLDTTGLGG